MTYYDSQDFFFMNWFRIFLSLVSTLRLQRSEKEGERRKKGFFV